jgi:hypothetical protein
VAPQELLVGDGKRSLAAGTSETVSFSPAPPQVASQETATCTSCPAWGTNRRRHGGRLVLKRPFQARWRTKWCRSGRDFSRLFSLPLRLSCNRQFSERRRRDSNPRYPVKRYNTLAGCRLQPLGHSSVSGGLYQKGRRRQSGRSSLWISSRLSSSRISGFSLAGLASRICSPEISSFILIRMALSVAPKRMVREEM